MRLAEPDRRVGEALVGEALGVLPFASQGLESLLQAGDLAEPDPLTGLGQSLDEVGLQLGEDRQAAGLGPQPRAAGQASLNLTDVGLAGTSIVIRSGRPGCCLLASTHA